MWTSHVNKVKAEKTLADGQKWAEPAYQTFGPAFAQPYYTEKNVPANCDNLVDGFYWTIDSWTRTAARSVVEYSYPGENGITPYECKGEMAGVAYEYVIKFNNASNKGYVELAKNEYIRAMITLPHDMDLHDYVITVYGQQEQSDRSRWNEGIIIPDFKGGYTVPVEGTSATENDGRFKLQNIALNSEKDYLEADIHFSTFKVGRSRIVQTTNSEDLLKHLKSYYGENAEPDQNKNTLFYVEAINEFVVTNELVAYVQKLVDNYNVNEGSKAGVFFTNVTDGGEIVFPADLTAVSGAATVYTLINESEDEDCVTCVDIPTATINVVSGSLTVEEEVDSYNNSIINNKASFIIEAAYFANNAEFNNEGTVTGTESNNEPSAVFNNGKEDATVAGFVYGTLSNSGEVNAYKGEIKSLKNIGGTLNVQKAEGNSVQTVADSNGEIVFKGVEALHIGLAGGDTRVFEVQQSQAGITSQDVVRMMRNTESTVLRTGYDITMVALQSQEVTYSQNNLKKLEIIDNMVDLAGSSSNVLNFNIAFKSMEIEVIGNDAELHIEYAKLKVKDVLTNSRPKVHVASGSDLLDENDAQIPNVIYHK